MDRQLYLVAYDVTAPGRLAAARKSVTAWAHGGQLSVWECWATGGEHLLMVGKVRHPLDLSEDRLAVLPLPRSGPVITLGLATPPVCAPLLYIG